jgi:transcriptional regulator with XRE-family HTH domain
MAHVHVVTINVPEFDRRVKEAGLSLNKLAVAAGINRTTLARWRNAGYRPNLDTLSRVIDILGCSLDDVTSSDVVTVPDRQPPKSTGNSMQPPQNHAVLRAMALMKYGLECACCGEPEYIFLTIDHIVPGKPDTGPRTRLYRWLKVNGYPAGFQTLCFNCNTAKGVKRHCPHRYREPMSDAARRTRGLKIDALMAYGSKVCVCCGEAGLEFLALDHVNGGGKEHRATLTGDGKLGGNAFYRALKKLGWPNDPPLRVLCHNCNHAVSMGACPHTW